MAYADEWECCPALWADVGRHVANPAVAAAAAAAAAHLVSVDGLVAAGTQVQAMLPFLVHATSLPQLFVRESLAHRREFGIINHSSSLVKDVVRLNNKSRDFRHRASAYNFVPNVCWGPCMLAQGSCRTACQCLLV